MHRPEVGRSPWPARLREGAFALGVWLAVLLVGLTVGALLWEVFAQGLPRLGWAYLSAPPEDAGRAGGVGPILVATLMILAVCMAVSLPLGLGAAIWLAGIGQPPSGLRVLVRRLVDLLAGVPSIVLGLFGNALFVGLLGLGMSVLSGGLTLACMVLPLLVRTTEEALSAVPPELRRAAEALALSDTRTLTGLLLPIALPGMIAGALLGLGRALAETAALIFTSGYADRMPASFWDSGRALTVHIYDLALNVSGGEAAAYAAASTLLLLIVLINALFLALAGIWRRRALRLP